MDREILATSAVKHSISMTDILSAEIKEGDKTASWDGFINIHENKQRTKKNIKRVPVQVKGKKEDIFPPQKDPTYPVELVDLVNWKEDGGIVFFLVLIDKTGDNNLIYYSTLTVIKIMNLIQGKENQKTISIPLKLFPNDNSEKVEIILNFYLDMKKQRSFSDATLYTLDDVIERERKGISSNISFSAVAYGESNKNDIISALCRNEVYFYENCSKFPVPIPLLDLIFDVHIMAEYSGNVVIDNKTFYNKFKVIRYKEGSYIQLGKGLRLEIKNNKQLIIDFRPQGMLSDCIRDTECIISLLEYGEISIKGEKISVNSSDRSSEIKQFKNDLNGYNNIKKMLETFGVRRELDCDSLSEQDKANINAFIKATIYKQCISFKENDTDIIYGNFRLGNLFLLIWAKKEGDNGYRLQNFFSNHDYFLYDSTDLGREHPYRASHYLILNKDHFLEADNVDYDAIIADMDKNDTSEVVFNMADLFMLELLSAYDSSDPQNGKLLDTAEIYCNWLCENWNEDFMVINRLQINKRRRMLDANEIETLQKLTQVNYPASIRCGANILLDRPESAQECFNEMGADEQKDFRGYPICYFWRPKIEVQ